MRSDRSTDVLSIEWRGDVCLATLSRGHVGNAINSAMALQLEGLLRDLEATGCRGLVITGEGRFFCTGGDLSEYVDTLLPAAVEEQFARMTDVCRALQSCAFPVIAALNGDAIGGGVELAVACDLRVSHPDATLCLPQVNLGLTTAWGAHVSVVRMVGEARALDLLLTGRKVPATEALSIGLISRIHPDPVMEALALAGAMSKAPPKSVAAMKRLVRSSSGEYPGTVADDRRLFFDLWPPDEGYLRSVGIADKPRKAVRSAVKPVDTVMLERS